MTLTVHQHQLELRRKALAELPREALLLRRTVLELAMAKAEEMGVDWRSDTAADDDPRPTMQEQHDLLDEALRNLPNPNPEQVVALQDGVGFIWVPRVEENTNG